MNNIFSLRRFGLLIKKNWLENRKRYLVGLGTYTLILYVFYIIMCLNKATYEDYRDNVQVVVYFPSLFIGGIIYAGLLFNDYNRKETGVFNLLLPASFVEKGLVNLVYGVVFFWIAFTCCFWIVDFTCISFTKAGKSASLFKPFSTNFYEGINAAKMNILFLFMQSIFVLGSIYFRKYAFFKTAAAVVTLVLVFSTLSPVRAYVSGKTIQPMAIPGSEAEPMSKLGYGASIDDFDLFSVSSSVTNMGSDLDNFIEYQKMSATFSPFVSLLLAVIVALVFAGCWMATCFRIKEKQV